MIWIGLTIGGLVLILMGMFWMVAEVIRTADAIDEERDD